MKKTSIIEEEELAELSHSIAERVLDLAEKFYRVTMHSRKTGKELGVDEMLVILALATKDAEEGENE